ncbi:MAG: tyrosine-type recombinase/integrase [Gammaproteobacteria bacterium]
MATLVKTQSDTWKAVIRKTGWPTTVKTFRTKRDATDWARRVEDEMVRGVYLDRAPSERITLKNALERYMHEVAPAKQANTHDRERVRAQILSERLGSYSLAAITPNIVARYRDNRLDEGKSNNTVRLELAMLSHLFNTAIREWGLGLVYNPVANIRKPSPGNGRNRRLSLAEEERLLSAVDQHSNPMLSWIARIALYSGMRQGEILSLHRDQVDLQRRLVRLDKTKNGDARTVPLSTRAAAVFREAIEHPMHKLVDTPLLFYGEPGRDGKRRPYVIHKVWAQAMQRAGLRDFRFHDLRHEAVSRLVEAGLSDQEVATISGHKSMQMLKRYTHLRAEDLVAKLDRALL